MSNELRLKRYLPTFSAFPSTPTRLPRRVYRYWDADSETESSEKGDPRTSNRASTSGLARLLQLVVLIYLGMFRPFLVLKEKENQRFQRVERFGYCAAISQVLHTPLSERDTLTSRRREDLAEGSSWLIRKPDRSLNSKAFSSRRERGERGERDCGAEWARTQACRRSCRLLFHLYDEVPWRYR